jgi:hypothetical protein
MIRIVENPFLVFIVSLLAQWGAAYLGDLLRRTVKPVTTEARADLDTVLTATLTLLALIIGFTFSMAVSRYDLRKNYEEAEANAIGTEFLRANLLPADDAANTRRLLRGYIDQRIAFYRSGVVVPGSVKADMTKTQNELWSSVVHGTAGQPASVALLVLWGMNDVINAESYTQSAWWNRIPHAAWALMGIMALVSNMLLGYRERRTNTLVLTVLPVIISIAFFLISDIDSPNGGIIRVTPYDLIAVSSSMR